MGCCGSLPKAEDFLVEQTMAATYLIPGLPPDLTMDAWQHTCAGKLGPDDRPQGVGGPQSLSIYGETPLAKLNMPPQMSLGIGADLLDAKGNAVAWLRSTATRRHLPIEGGSYNIFGVHPLDDGKAGQDGKYLWATVQAPTFGRTFKVVNSSGTPTFEACLWGSPPYNFTLKAGGQGIMLCGKTNDNPKRHNIQVAKGADPALSICIMYAVRLIEDEEYSNT
mmetsp:Transcript_53353/g.114662  ORF Transcript_53353/g.114662 Transcript_53353/m.114662 type:complete len:222 (+) Transcript_53353:96-761(+)